MARPSPRRPGRLPGMHTELEHRGELRVAEEHRPKRIFLLDVLHMSLRSDTHCYIGHHPLFEQLANAGFAEIVEGAIRQVSDSLWPIEGRTRL